MKVLSLFNGMNCIGLALTKLGVEFELYASEIDKYANQVSTALFPNTVNLGDVTKIKLKTLSFVEVYSYLVEKYYNNEIHNLQSVISERNLLFRINQEQSFAATFGTQIEVKEQKVPENPILSNDSRIWFWRNKMGDNSGVFDIIFSGKRGEVSDKKLVREMPECSFWWNGNRQYESRTKEKGFRGAKRESPFSRDKRKTSERYVEILLKSRECRKEQAEVSSSIQRPCYEEKVFRCKGKARLEADSPKTKSNKKKETRKNVFGAKKGIQAIDENDRAFEDYRNLVHLYKGSQVTVVECEWGITIFKGVFQLCGAGSPCQGFSFAGKQLNFEDERSKLFFEFTRILGEAKQSNPNVKFLLENVKMKKEYEAVISRFMGIDPIEINSALLSAQNRKRLYWTNIGTTKANLFGIEEPGIKQPGDKGILLKDILESEVDEKYFLSNTAINYMNASNEKFTGKKTRFEHYPNPINGKAGCLTANMFKGAPYGILNFGKANNGKEIFIDQNCNPPCTFYETRTEQGKEERRIQSKIKGKDTTPRGKDSKMYLTQPHNKANCLVTNQTFLDAILIIPKATKKGFAEIRRLTPRECARLQTVPEWAIDKMLDCGVSDSQLYKMLGNGWTVDVIAYILSHME